MSYHTPAGFGDRCVMRCDDAAHQIRIILTRNTLKVSCTCRPVTDKGGSTTLHGPAGPQYKPIASIKNADQAWEQWWVYHDAMEALA